REGKQYEEEGCLSIPEIREKVVRAAKVRVRAQDEHGKWFETDGEELLSRAFQHEIDHLDGMLFIFRISGLKRDLALRKIRKLQREGKW
ncbi:MAG TPA: peptide deformylase, partial [Terracidiphilus sp.]|nr:peptide deformylase [Terracidiphilus sp.]